MAAKRFNSRTMKDVDLIMGDPATGDNFKVQLRSVNLDPDTNIARIKTLSPEGTFADADPAEWTLAIGYLNGNVIGDTGNAPTLFAHWLFDHALEQVDFLFRPIAGGEGWSGTVTVVAGGVGGDQGSYSEKTVNLPLTGQPVPVAAV